MAERSLHVHPNQLETVGRAYKINGHTRQADFAEAVGLGVDALRAFLKGKPVDRETFMKFCEALDLDHQEIIQEPSFFSNATSGNQINQSAHIIEEGGFMIGSVGTFNQR